MNFNYWPFIFLFLLLGLFEHGPLASGTRIPSRSYHTAQDNSPKSVELPGLNFLVKYVCPDATNLKRNTVAVPINQLVPVLLKLQQMEEDILILIGKYNNEGQLDSEDPSGVFIGEDGEEVVSISDSSTTSIDFGSPSSAVNSLASALASSSFVALNSGVSSATMIQLTSIETEVVSSTIVDLGDTIVAAISTAVISSTVPSKILANESASIASTSYPGSATRSTSLQHSNKTPLVSVAASSTSKLGSSLATASTSFLGSAAKSTLFGGAVSSSSRSDLKSAANVTKSFDSVGSTTNRAISTKASSASYTNSKSGTAEDSTTGYTFSALSSKNVAVYFGQTPVTGGTTLALQCADLNIDIVILAFVIASSDGGPYPQINFGAACGGQTSEMMSKAPGLLSCPQLAADITTCQTKYGKKVLLSIGGATSQISFPTTTSASTFATMLWNLFGPPGNVDVGLRPFGTAQVDGFDVDNEDNLSANWDTFASTLRSLFASIKTKTYYLSSAPQCPFPDASNPQALLLLCDFVWVQFYNNPPCEIGSTGFAASLQQWSNALLKSTLTVKPRLYLGAPAFSAAGSSAYAAIGNAQGMQGIAKNAEKMGLSNFGGVMFWDGPEGMLNTYGGKDILAWAKSGLNA